VARAASPSPQSLHPEEREKIDRFRKEKAAHGYVHVRTCMEVPWNPNEHGVLRSLGEGFFCKGI